MYRDGCSLQALIVLSQGAHWMLPLPQSLGWSPSATSNKTGNHERGGHPQPHPTKREIMKSYGFLSFSKESSKTDISRKKSWNFAETTRPVPYNVATTVPDSSYSHLQVHYPVLCFMLSRACIIMSV